MTDSACPDLDRLLRFLEGTSPGVDDEAIAGPRRGVRCLQGRARAAGRGDRPPALRSARTGRESPADLAFLRDLKGLDLSHLSEGTGSGVARGIPAARGPRL